MPYLKSTVGGHGRDAIYEMLNYAKKDFDGVIQLLPFGCFVKDTNITVENYLQKPIQDIKVGEKVLTHKGRFKKVIHKFCRNYQGSILKIDCGGKLLTISVTPEHPLFLAKTIIRGGRKEIQGFKFTPAYQAKKGDFVAIPIPLEDEVEDPVSIDYSAVRTEPNLFRVRKEINKFTFKPDLLKLLGYYLAEGTIFWERKENIKLRPCGVGFCFNVNEKDYINDVLQIISKNFGLKAKVKTNFSPNSAVVTVYNRNLADFMKYLCGFMPDKKRLSRELLNLEPSLQKEILKGFFRGDGNFTDKYGETTYRGVTTSWDLASQLFWLLIRNRIKPSLIEQNIKNRKISYMLKIANAGGIKRLDDELIKVTDRKNNVRFRELENYFLIPIRKIELMMFRGKVYNLTVEDDHSYIANFIAVKNCMPESSVRPILQKIHLETGIPFLSLSLDEQVAEAGINTRIEAFVDVVKNYYHKKHSNILT
jgi:intein/homing endonuclease